MLSRMLVCTIRLMKMIQICIASIIFIVLPRSVANGVVCATANGRKCRRARRTTGDVLCWRRPGQRRRRLPLLLPEDVAARSAAARLVPGRVAAGDAAGPRLAW